MVRIAITRCLVIWFIFKEIAQVLKLALFFSFYREEFIMPEEKSLEQKIEDIEKIIVKLLQEIENLKKDLKDLHNKQESFSQRLNRNHLR